MEQKHDKEMTILKGEISNKQSMNERALEEI